MANIAKVNEKICRDLNATENKKYKIVWGKREDYSYIIGASKNYANVFYVKFSVSKDKARINDEYIKEMNTLSEEIMNINVPSFDVTIYVKQNANVDEQAKSIEDIISKMIEFFKAKGIDNVDEMTGDKASTSACSIYSNIKLLSDSTINTKMSEQTNQTDDKEENVVMGVLGAIVGSVIGGILIVLFGQLGFVASLSGVVMGYATLAGYKRLGNKIDKKGIIISIAIMIIMTYLASRINAAILIKRELPYMDAFEVFKNLPNLIKYGLIKGNVYYGNMAMTYLFTALGAFSSIKQYATNVHSERTIVKL